MSATDLITVVRRRRALVIAAFLACVAAALAFSLTQTKTYTASAGLLFRDPMLDQKLFGSTVVTPNPDPTREAATNEQLVGLEVVAARTTRALHLHLTPEQLQGKVTISSKGASDVVSVNATDPSPRFAAELANTFASQYIDFRRLADQAKVRQAQQLVLNQIRALSPAGRASPQGRLLQARAEQLRIMTALQTGNAELVQPAVVPTSPSSPRIKRNVALAAIIGLLIGIAIALLAERVDRRFRSPDDVTETTDLPVVAVVPASSALRSTKGTSLPAREVEAFRMLRASLRYFNVDRPLDSVLVTSAGPGDGKSTVAWNLAAVAAEAEPGRVLLLEADFRRPRLARALGLPPLPGLAESLAVELPLDEVTHTIDGRSSSVVAPDAVLDVIVAGTQPPDPMRILESERMGAVLAELRGRYGLVVIDTPPLPVVPDVVPLLKNVDGVLPVCRIGYTTRDDARRLLDQLRGFHAPLVGVVANDVSSEKSAYDAYYVEAPRQIGVEDGRATVLSAEDVPAVAEPRSRD